MSRGTFVVQERKAAGRMSGLMPSNQIHQQWVKPPERTSLSNHNFGQVSVYPSGGLEAACPLAAPRTCPFGGACHACPVRVQAKMKVGQADNAYEREAEQVARQVMGMAEPLVSGRQNAEGQSPVRLKATLSAPAGIEINPAVEAQIQSLSGGQSLSESQRLFFESRLGRDLGCVHLHTDGKAAYLAHVLGARAFSLGSDLVFGSGEYDFSSSEGRSLIAHELVHSLQQAALLGPVVQRTVECEEWIPVDDATTQRLIDEAMDDAGDDVEVAFDLIKSRRNSSDANCCDLNYAAADHYIFSRSLTASGDTLVGVLASIATYSLIPRWLTPVTGNCPVSPNDSSVNAWAVQGALDGRVDWEAAHPMRGGREDRDVTTNPSFGSLR